MHPNGPPMVSVGLVTGADQVSFEFKGQFSGIQGQVFGAGSYRAARRGGILIIESQTGGVYEFPDDVRFSPLGESDSFVIRDVLIGIDFHWERRQDQEFQGSLKILCGDSLTAINEIDVESYLLSVISSEMSATANPELLNAHAVISRSWLLAQLPEWKPRIVAGGTPPSPQSGEIIRWYDRENHSSFDVCADDHCQRYQGVTRATTQAVHQAVSRTSGQVLRYGGELCDARFSKSCGGMTERFDAAWSDIRIPYLDVAYDGETFPIGFELPLSIEENAAGWIRGSPPAFCNTSEASVLRRILPDFDQETMDFYRWQVTIEQEELQHLLSSKLDLDLGPVISLEPVERGGSGRLIRLRIVGKSGTIVIGKELEIRRALSKSHLFSSAFVIDAGQELNGTPRNFVLTGAGWGHGVGLCQIGAALMAEKGYTYRQILGHYYHHAEIDQLY